MLKGLREYTTHSIMFVPTLYLTDLRLGVRESIGLLHLNHMQLGEALGGKMFHFSE